MSEQQNDFTSGTEKKTSEEPTATPAPRPQDDETSQPQFEPAAITPSTGDGDGSREPAIPESSGEPKVIVDKKDISLWPEVRTWLRDLSIAAIICLLLIVYVAQPFRVEKTSMEPLLHDGDRILVNKIALAYEPINRGDIVVLWNPRDPDESWIKRVIGLPGEHVQIIDGVVHIDGLALDEPYIPAEERNPPKNSFPSRNAEWLTENYPERMEEFGFTLMEDWIDGPGHGTALRVPEGYYFVCGDHRRFSMDSRDSVYPAHSGGPGLIPKKYIYGKAVFRYWPLDSVGFIPAHDYTK